MMLLDAFYVCVLYHAARRLRHPVSCHAYQAGRLYIVMVRYVFVALTAGDECMQGSNAREEVLQPAAPPGAAATGDHADTSAPGQHAIPPQPESGVNAHLRPHAPLPAHAAVEQEGRVPLPDNGASGSGGPGAVQSASALATASACHAPGLQPPETANDAQPPMDRDAARTAAAGTEALPALALDAAVLGSHVSAAGMDSDSEGPLPEIDSGHDSDMSAGDGSGGAAHAPECAEHACGSM